MKPSETLSPNESDLSHHLAEALVAISAGGVVERLNPAAERLFLISDSEARGMRCMDVVRSELCTSACPREAVLATGAPVTNFNYGLAGEDGSPRRPMCVLSSVVRDSDGRATGIVETFRDVVEIVRVIEHKEAAAESARQTVEWLSAIVDTIGDAVITSDTSIRITGFNRAAEMLTGYSREEVLGRSCKEVFSTGFCPLEETLVKSAGLAGLETRMRAKTGRLLPVWLTTELLCDSSGRAIGAIQLVRDRSAMAAGAGEASISPLAGSSPAMMELGGWIDRLAKTDSTVLLTGESGTGKELVAEAIHFRSARREKPLIKVNSAALPETLLESELFGHVRGAFTGAVADRSGRFELAHRGTLFLDEIGDLPLSLQAKLLRVLQDRCVERLGSGRPVPVDIRVIAATNRDLTAMVADGRFREDLYYRLAVVPVEVPPLRERIEDVPDLIVSILGRLRSRRVPAAVELAPAAVSLMMAYRWPGNVRELENALEYASIRAGEGRIEPAHLPATVRTPVDLGSVTRTVGSDSARIRAALARCSSAAEAAASLGISRATLFRRMKALGLSFDSRQSLQSHP